MTIVRIILLLRNDEVPSACDCSSMSMSAASDALKARTENFAVGVVKFCETLPNSIAGRKIAGQLIDASTSVAANYRAACRAYTRPLFVSKLAIVSEEADESELWLRILRRTGLQSPAAIGPLEQEAHELASIFTASLRTARGQRKRPAGCASPRLLILQSTIFNPTTIRKSNNLRIFQFCEGLRGRATPARRTSSKVVECPKLMCQLSRSSIDSIRRGCSISRGGCAAPGPMRRTCYRKSFCWLSKAPGISRRLRSGNLAVSPGDEQVSRSPEKSPDQGARGHDDARRGDDARTQGDG